LGLEQLLTSSPRYAPYNATVALPTVTFNVPDYGRSTMEASSRQSEAIASIVKSVEAKYLWRVWTYTALYLIAVLPNERGGVAEFAATVTVTWNAPEGGSPRRFRVKTFAENTKPQDVVNPAILATVRFEVEDLN
jgi:hypothetical protein